MSATISVDLEEEERQALLLAMAKLAVERPGWDHFLTDISHKLRGDDMFTEFKRLEAMRAARRSVVD